MPLNLRLCHCHSSLPLFRPSLAIVSPRSHHFYSRPIAIVFVLRMVVELCSGAWVVPSARGVLAAGSSYRRGPAWARAETLSGGLNRARAQAVL